MLASVRDSPHTKWKGEVCEAYAMARSLALGFTVRRPIGDGRARSADRRVSARATFAPAAVANQPPADVPRTTLTVVTSWPAWRWACSAR